MCGIRRTSFKQTKLSKASATKIRFGWDFRVAWTKCRNGDDDSLSTCTKKKASLQSLKMGSRRVS